MKIHTLSYGLVVGFGAIAGPAIGQPIASEVVGRVVERASERGVQTPTIREIMRDPEWIARSPSGARWADDGSAVYYRRERAGDEGLSDTWVVRFDEDGEPGEPEIVADEDLDTLPSRRGDWEQTDDGAMKVFTRSGDLWVQDVVLADDGVQLSERQLTQTSARESGPFFVLGGAALAFDRGGTILVRDLMTNERFGLVAGRERELILVELKDEPKDLEERWAEEDEKQDDLEDQQERLFEIVRDRERRSRARQAWGKETRDADEFQIPTVYLGGKHQKKSIRLSGRSLNETTDWMAVIVREETKDAKRDVIPEYVEGDGYVGTRSIRPKVGLVDRAAQWVAMVDIENETAHWLDWGELPMVRDDPLAWLQDKDEAEEDGDQNAENAENAEGAEEESEAEGEKKEDEGAVREISVMRQAWSYDGSHLALMLRSNDNKDRWLVVVNVREVDEDGVPRTTVVEHQREEGWINWSFNQMGWTRTGVLWFTSEAPGYSGLCTWDPQMGGEPDLVVGGDGFVVDSVGMTPDGLWLYCRTNRNHPTEWELERYHVVTRRHEVVTEFGHSIDSYTVVPVEDAPEAGGRDGHRVVVSYSTHTAPGELYQFSLPSMVARPLSLDDATRLTHTVEDSYAEFDYIEPAFVEIESSHTDLPIHARVYLDENAPVGPNGRPVVIFSHGAGYLQHVYKGWTGYFREHLFHTLLARAGAIVIAPDFRASRGYGKEWRQAIYRRMGEPELQDFDDCLAWAADEHGADLLRVGIYGGSYGGFMSIMAMFERPGVYRAGAALRPVTDWMHYNDGYTANILNTPQVDPEAYLKSSPIEYAERFREGGVDGRLLLLHGMVDDNVVVQDSIRLAQRLIELEKEGWEMALYPVEPHGFREPTGWLDEYRRIFSLFAQEVLDPAWLEGWPAE